MFNLNAMKIITGCMTSTKCDVMLANGGGSAPLGSTVSMLMTFGDINKLGKDATLNTSNGTGLYFGSTAHPATIDEIDFPDTSDLVYFSGSGTTPVVEFFDDHADIFTALTLTNSESSPVVISEIYYARFWYNGYGYLLDHTVLDTPITVPANGVRSLTYTVRINF